jgi:beta-lactamase superfamily II metal-dependent hydrolase
MSITVRAYNVLFGDCLLVSWDEADGKHHAWVDFGNFHNDKNAVFTTVYEDVLRRTKGELDLVVVTHRHLDHMEGFYTLRKRFAQEFSVDRLWYAHVTRATDHLFELADREMRQLMPAGSLAGEGTIGRIYHNNHYLGTADRMNEILADFPAQSTHDIYRGKSLTKATPSGMKRLKIAVLAPEQDSKVYLDELHEGLAARSALHRYFGTAAKGRRARDEAIFSAPTDGADSPLASLADFARLRRKLRSTGLEVLAAVDRTRNNTSIVMRWTYENVKILLTGDAELRSWDIMRQHKADFACRLVKVGHHGSINASPDWSYAEVLPKRLDQNAVIISTDETRFTGENEVPKAEVLDGWKSRLTKPKRMLRTDAASVQPGQSVAVTFQT